MDCDSGRVELERDGEKEWDWRTNVTSFIIGSKDANGAPRKDPGGL